MILLVSTWGSMLFHVVSKMTSHCSTWRMRRPSTPSRRSTRHGGWIFWYFRGYNKILWENDDYLIPLAINNSSTIEINTLWYFSLYFCKIVMEHCYVIGKFQVNHHNSPTISHWTDVILGLQKKSASLVPIFRKLLLMPSPGSPSPRRECFVGSTPNSWPSDDIFPNNRRQKKTPMVEYTIRWIRPRLFFF